VTPNPVLSGRGQLVDGEFVFTAEDFRRIASILYADAGISLADSKATLVYSRLAKRLRALGLASFQDYCRLVGEQEGVDERQRMLAALTTNVTRFFREPHHFDHLRSKVLPRLAERARAGGRVRLWSAGCSTGPEPYSIAMTLLEALPEAVELDVRILATDIDPNVLAEAREGTYSDQALQPAPAEARRRWFRPEKSGGQTLWRAGESLQSLIAFRELNLVAPPWPMRGRFDVIFCRNVMIYFDDATQRRVVGSLADHLQPGGQLYIGHSERVVPEERRLVSDGLTSYRLREGAAA
jgi:chemotaxis protein methyltransferase CheR